MSRLPRKAQVYVETAFIDTFIPLARLLYSGLASASGVQVGGSFNLPGAVSIVTPDATIKIPMDELTDKEAERVRLQRERDNVKKQLDGVLARLENQAFIDKAPEAVVAGARENAARLQDKLNLLDQSLAALS